MSEMKKALSFRNGERIDWPKSIQGRWNYYLWLNWKYNRDMAASLSLFASENDADSAQIERISCGTHGVQTDMAMSVSAIVIVLSYAHDKNRSRTIELYK